jgi:hypothetical protein
MIEDNTNVSNTRWWRGQGIFVEFFEDYSRRVLNGFSLGLFLNKIGIRVYWIVKRPVVVVVWSIRRYGRRLQYIGILIY